MVTVHLICFQFHTGDGAFSMLPVYRIFSSCHYYFNAYEPQGSKSPGWTVCDGYEYRF